MTKPSSYICNECSREFKSSRGLKVHQGHHRSARGILNGATKRPSLPACPQNVGEGDLCQVLAKATRPVRGKNNCYICTECGENLKSFTAMKAHQHIAGCGRSHSTDSKAGRGPPTAADILVYKCPNCKKNFQHSSSLSRHQRSKAGKCGAQGCATPARRHQGPAAEKIRPRGGGSSVEGEGSDQAPAVRRSQRRRPVRAEPLRCTECQRQFKEVDDLHEHYMRHARGVL